MSYTIITDSATDMPQWIREKYNLLVIPTPVVINGEDYFDGTTIKPEEFYEIQKNMGATGTTISTYHINQHMFYENFKPFAERGEEVVYFCFSTGIAGTFGAANLAKTDLLEEYPDFDITIIDSKQASMGFGLVVYQALMMQEAGCSKEEVVEAARYHFDNMEAVFTVETLEFLYRGGRLSKTSEIVGSILDIKPIIEVTDEGKLSVCEKQRGRKKSLKRLQAIMGERGVDLDKQVIAVVHANCEDVADSFAKEIEETYHPAKIIKAMLGCAIGAHTGPGLIALCFLSAEDPYNKYYNFD